MLYKGNKLKEISFPLGGIGTGCIGLAGNGSFVDWEIFNRPNKGSINDYSCFAVKARFPDGSSVTKILQGDHMGEFSGRYGNKRFSGIGPSAGTMCALSHFKKVIFDGSFPIAKLTFTDDEFPAKVTLTAFNPFIPLNADDSGIPAAFFDVEIKSDSPDIEYTVILSVRNPFESTKNEPVKSEKYTAVKLFNAALDKDEIGYGDLTIASCEKEGIVQRYWYRGGWQDKLTTFWHDLCYDQMEDRCYDDASIGDVASVGAVKLSNSSKKANFRFVLSWNVPNNYNYWDPYKDENGKDISWKNYYATIFDDSAESAFYALDNWDRLYKKTLSFKNALHGSTLDKSIIDAVSSTISVLKSPTVLRLSDGTFYGWEGVHEYEGSCEGTCTHVWSYAYALCFLFPELERSLRDTELKIDTDENGLMQFRTRLPLDRDRTNFHPCVDGQMATIIKIYRDWKLTGNSNWLRDNWNDIKKVLEFAWSDKNVHEWDSDHDGILEGRQHHTLDMELFGPSSWLEGMYLAALKGAAEMAGYLGDSKKQKEYLSLFQNGYDWMKDNLFNGSYFIHKIDVTDRSYADHFDAPQYWNEEKKQLKYQIADGCEIDQMLGQWHANISNLGDIFDKAQRKTALESMLKNNFKPKMRDFSNMWRVFALNDEAGTVMCDYPDGVEKPVIPIPYCEECMTGFEYAFAGLLISEGFIDEGIKAVKAIRDRYDGAKRNPWNEIECGSNYARPMASFALLPIFSGFTFDLPNKHIGFAPIVSGDYKAFFSVGTGWGNYIRKPGKHTVDIIEGSLCLKSLTLGDIGKIKQVYADGKRLRFEQIGQTIYFDETTIKRNIKIVL